jgi:hypothetical protein
MDDDDKQNGDETSWPDPPINLPDEVKGLYFTLRMLPDQRIIGLHRLLFHWTLHIDIDDTGYSDRYCYADLAGALEGFLGWDGSGDPPGPWHRHPDSRRRRDPATGAIWTDDQRRPAAGD